MRHGLFVLALRERVHRPELLAAPGESLDAREQRIALIARERLLGGLRREAKPAGDLRELALGVRGGVAHLLGGDLRVRHGLARRA